MSSFINKILDFVSDDDEYDEDFTDEQEMDEEPERPTYTSTKKGKVVNIHSAPNLKVVVMQPEKFDDAKDIADHLKTKKPVVINLEDVEVETARRIVDFLSGSVYALDGNIQKVTNGIFLIAPYNVDIMSDIKEELPDKNIFPWNK